MASDQVQKAEVRTSMEIGSMHDILKTASAGRALKGILIRSPTECTEKQTVIETPTDVDQMSPSMELLDDKEVVFNSRSEFDQFMRLDASMRLDVTGKLSGGRDFKILGFQLAEVKAEAESKTMFEREAKLKSESHRTEHFYGRVKCTTVPTVACQLKQHSLRFSQGALNDLGPIEALIKGSDDEQMINQECETFLDKYGSHVNVGVMHLGGECKTTSVYTSCSKSADEEIKAKVKASLDSHVSGSAKVATVPVSGGISAGAGGSASGSSKSHDQHQSDNVFIESKMKGGPQEVENPKEWKEGLVKSPGKWAILQRESTLLGIWELIPKHEKGEFTHPQELADALRAAWEKMSGMSSECSSKIQKVTSAVQCMDEVVSHVHVGSWVLDESFGSTCIGRLQILVERVNNLETETGRYKYWVDVLCKEKQVTNFLTKIVDCRDALSASDVYLARWNIQKLVEPARDKEFPGKQQIIDWLEEENDSVTSDVVSIFAGVQSISDLITIIKDKFIPTLQQVSAGEGETVAATQLAQGIGEITEALKNDQHQLLFLRLVLFDLQYDSTSTQFGTSLTMDAMGDFASCLEEKWTDFQLHKEKGEIERDSFLIHMLLTCKHFHQDEDMVKIMIEDIMHSMAPKMRTWLDKHTGCWEELRKVTAELATGNMKVLEGNKIEILEPASMLPVDNKHENLPKHQASSKDPTGFYADLLHKMGLENYYPHQISLRQAMAITPKSSQQMELQDLPWQMIRRLIMANHHCRDLLVSEMNRTLESQCNKDNQSDDGWGSDDSAESQGSDDIVLHPLDVLLATSGCCDQILQQMLAQKLFACKLAIPFVFPSGSSHDLAMSLWSLRTIIAEWCDRKDITREMSVTDQEFPVISFVRLGAKPANSSLSTSRLINNVMTDGVHNIFCVNEQNEQISDGLIECSWLLPRNKQGCRSEDNQTTESSEENQTADSRKDHLTRPVMFLNMRGDGYLHPKQMGLLSTMSSVVVVIANTEKLGDPTCMETFAQICKAPNVSKVLLLPTDELSQTDKKKLKHTWKQSLGEDFSKIKLNKGTTGTTGDETDLAKDVRDFLLKEHDQCIARTIKQISDELSEQEVTIDERDPTCQEGFRLAQNVMGHVSCMEECKKNLFLQGTEWHEYSKLLKEQHRGQTPPQSNLRTNMRNKQANHIRKMAPFMREFIRSLQTSVKDDDLSDYFLEWMKILLDEKSRHILPALRRKCHSEWKRFQEERKGNKEEQKRCVEEADAHLEAASFGLEHLLRELGQMYEAMIGSSYEVDVDTKRVIESLPEIVARLLTRGTPLEMFDGDAGIMPITWIRAVLDKLANIVGRDKKLVVFSVLGIQSSGKSTLLNTMFGLKLAVSAGRCTKGAFVQLVPVDKTTNLPFDYIVVVDTEGLRAGELDDGKRDNELATFAIGLGDVTIMNIKGENVAEIRDVLQIVVHAFLRMKIAAEYAQRACIFIHQNVTAVNAKEMMVRSSEKLLENLDSVTKAAAAVEKSDIERFCDIRNFDIDKHVWHLPDLWHGIPPMAAVSVDYSEGVENIKSKLQNIVVNQDTSLTVSDFSLHVDDLQKAILMEDYVFSFRNSLEIKAHDEMDIFFREHQMEFQREINEWIRIQEKEMQRAENADDLESRYQGLVDTLPGIVRDAGHCFKECLRSYFQKCELKEIAMQWEEKYVRYADAAAFDIETEGKKKLSSTREKLWVAKFMPDKQKNYEGTVMQKATNFADGIKNKEIAETQLEQQFEQVWRQIVSELAAPHGGKVTVNIPAVIETELYNCLPQHDHKTLREQLKAHPLTEALEHHSLEGSVSHDFIEDDDIKMGLKDKAKQMFKHGVGWVFGNQKVSQVHRQTLLVTRTILSEISRYIETHLHNQRTMFEKSRVADVMQILEKGIREQNDRDNSFQIRSCYTVKLAVHTFRYCLQKFQSMHDAYDRKHGLESQLNQFKETTRNLFRNTVRQSTEETIVTDILCDKLLQAVKNDITSRIPEMVVSSVCKEFSHNKTHLLMCILHDLAESEAFLEYTMFTSDSQAYATDWVRGFIEKSLFPIKVKNSDGDGGSDSDTESDKNAPQIEAQVPKSGSGSYLKLAQPLILESLRDITSAVESATAQILRSKGKDMVKWMKVFRSHCSFPLDSCEQIVKRAVTNFGHLDEKIRDRIQGMKESLEDFFRTQSRDTVQWESPAPWEKAVKNVWGCPEQCPFCGEPCSRTAADHYDREASRPDCHVCRNHRPRGVTGRRIQSTGELPTETCSFETRNSVAKFTCSTVNYACQQAGICTPGRSALHSYRDYKAIFPGWYIPADISDESSIYWQWFMATFKQKLETYYGGTIDVPGRWRSITKEEALTGLRMNTTLRTRRRFFFGGGQSVGR